jgi:ribosomal protein S18 acetylase RimI-like enzyme
MTDLQEHHRVGAAYLAMVTTLLQRCRAAHPTAGLYEAAELQWWWSIPRPTDELAQLFWFDDDGRPEAAVLVHDFSDGSSALYEAPTIVIIVMPDATPEWVAHVVERGLAHIRELGMETVELEVDQADEVMRDVLMDRGFTVKEDGLTQCWLAADDRAEISPLPEDYRLFSRSETMHLPHHMADQRRPNVEERLLETSLYRPDLDLVVLDGEQNAAGYGMFWYDPETATGVVEPMRTHDDHQQRGIARHLLTAGIDRLAAAGAERISIGYEPDNPASGHLYLSVGFEAHRQTDVLSGPATTPRA